MRLTKQISFEFFNIGRFYIVVMELYVARSLVILMFSLGVRILYSAAFVYCTVIL